MKNMQRARNRVKYHLKRAWLLFMVTFLLPAFLCGCGQKTQKMDEVREWIVGSWEYTPDDADYYRYQYTFTKSGTITQQAWGYDQDGNEIDISLGSMAGFTYEITSDDTLELKGSFQGIESEIQKFHIGFPDHDTMILGDSTYTRVSAGDDGT